MASRRCAVITAGRQTATPPTPICVHVCVAYLCPLLGNNMHECAICAVGKGIVRHSASCGKFSTGKNGSKAATELTSKATPAAGAFFMPALPHLLPSDTFLIELRVGEDGEMESRRPKKKLLASFASHSVDARLIYEWSEAEPARKGAHSMSGGVAPVAAATKVATTTCNLQRALILYN